MCFARHGFAVLVLAFYEELVLTAAFRLRSLFLFGLLAANVVTSAFSLSAQAYDEDTHFYGTYSMARYAGIRHEVAVKIGLAAQWMDESFLSDPTSMILLPVTGIKKRRLLHFPSSRIVGVMANETQESILGIDQISMMEKFFSSKLINFYGFRGKTEVINFMTETTEDNPFASELLMMGLKQGNLMMAAASLHTLEDSFAHAGTPAEQGHAMFWHWPDRPFAAPEKYFRMVDAVFSALVAIRTQLPPEALDCKLRLAPLPGSKSNCDMSATELAQNYSATEAVIRVVRTDVLRNPDYVRAAMRDFFERAQKAKYTNLDPVTIEAILAHLPGDGKLDSYETAEALIKGLIKTRAEKGDLSIDVKFILSDMGHINPSASLNDVRDYIDSYGPDADSLASVDSAGITNFVRVLAEQLLKWKVPAPLTDHHRMEAEDDKSPIRKREMELRTNAMREMIHNLFGTDIKLLPNGTKDAAGFWAEITLNPKANPVIPDGGQRLYATFSLSEKNEFDKIIFQYLFPDLHPADLVNIVQAAARLKGIGNAFGEHALHGVEIAQDKTLNLVSRTWKKLQNDRAFTSSAARDAFAASWAAISQIKPIVPTFLSDLVNRHLRASPDNLYYRNPRLFTDYKNRGIVKTFLSDTDVWKISDLL